MSRPRDRRREMYTTRYGLTRRQRDRLTQAKMDQLDRCASDAMRRLLLGVR